MVDIDAAIGYVVAHGDPVDRARLSWLRAGKLPDEDVLAKAEMGQTAAGGWPAYWGAHIASVDATCFRLAELDDLGALGRPPARRGLEWLSSRQREDGTWEEDEALADTAPPWATPGDPEARLYLTASAGYWLAVAGPSRPAPSADANVHSDRVARAANAFRSALRSDGSWPSYLAAGWFGAALLYQCGWFYEAAQVQVILAERVPQMSPADTAAMAAALRRVGVGPDDWLLVAARRRLAETQRSDGGWTSDDGDAFDVHTTLTAIRAVR
ncbi:MAG TPA: prenyltransferase/squalene oxidase repeat-containing protein [Micromonosporaceae bacterium]